MTSKIETYVAKRLAAIQKRNNFDPHVGARQISGRPEMRADYIRFKELIALIQACNLSVKIPFEAREVLIDSVEPDVHVYAFQKIETTIFKIGWSRDPDFRIGQVQTSNEGALTLVDLAPGGFTLEQAIHRHLRLFKTRHRNRAHKGEWFNIDPKILAKIFVAARSGETFSNLPTLKRKRIRHG